MKGILTVISGPSGCGKDTLCIELVNKYNHVVIAPSYTTREETEGDVSNSQRGGKQYYFVDKPTFEKMIEEDAFFEHADVYGHLYGVPKKQVTELLEKGLNVILIIDIAGAMNIKKLYPDCKTIYILPPSFEVLKERIMKRRRESEEDMKERLDNAWQEMQSAKYYDMTVVNDKLEDAVDTLAGILGLTK